MFIESNFKSNFMAKKTTKPNPNYPSTNPGKPSGKDRGNTPKPKKGK
jgi:hypothetical protein